MNTWEEEWYQELAKEENRYLAVSGRATLRQAFALLGSPKVNGATSWHLVVARTDGKWAFEQFAALYQHAQSAGESMLDIPLDELDWLLEAQETQVVDLPEIGIGEAKEEARQAPGGVLLVMDSGELAGILYTATMRGELLVSTSALTELAGRTADLKELGHFAIIRRRPKSKIPVGKVSGTDVAVDRDAQDTLAQGLKLATRYTDIACPRRVWVETPRVSVVVRLTVPEPSHSAAVKALALRKDLPVRVRIETPGFEIINDQEQEALILPDSDSQPLVFDLHPLQVGPTRITFDFFQQGNPVGTVSVPVEITAQEVSVAQLSHSRQSLRIEPNVQPPDYMLYVSYERSSERPALIFTLFRSCEVGRTFHPVLLQSDPQAQALQFYEQLTVLANQVDPTMQAVLGEQRVLPPEDIDRRLMQFGQNLWRSLIPEDLKTIYAEERDMWRDRTLLIVSDEPYIPWELVWPYGRGWQDDVPWCTSLRLTRWLRRDARGNGHEAPPTRLLFRSLACLAPTDSALPAARRERQFLVDLLAQRGISDVSPASPTWSQVLDLLEAGGYDWLHAAAHGNFYPEAPDADSAIWLQGRRPLTPNAIVGAAIESYIHEHRPGFAFNACYSGREGWALTCLGGWANRLISTGAGLFLGPLWAVEDQAALAFAQTFYQQLLDGETVAEAVRQSRLSVYHSGDPSWLAYSVYAHPNARLVF